LGASFLPAYADSLSVTGTVTQDALGGAINNPQLNNVTAYADNYQVSFDLATPLTGAGTYSASNLAFDDTTAGVAESGFDPFSLFVIDEGTSYELSIHGCLTGYDCSTGNSLDMIFDIPTASLTGTDLASADPFFVPLNMFEDDGATDIQGDVSAYVYSSSPVSSVPEPAAIVLLGSGLLGLVSRKLRVR
jgi:hypothetical protein